MFEKANIERPQELSAITFIANPVLRILDNKYRKPAVPLRRIEDIRYRFIVKRSGALILVDAGPSSCLAGSRLSVGLIESIRLTSRPTSARRRFAFRGRAAILKFRGPKALHRVGSRSRQDLQKTTAVLCVIKRGFLLIRGPGHVDDRDETFLRRSNLIPPPREHRFSFTICRLKEAGDVDCAARQG